MVLLFSCGEIYKVLVGVTFGKKYRLDMGRNNYLQTLSNRRMPTVCPVV